MKFDKNMLAQFQQMQQDLVSAQEALKTETVTASAGGGVVRVTLTGDQRCTAVEIDPKLLEDADAAMLQDLVLAAFNQALNDSRQLALDRLGPLSAGLGLG
jgi:hypothetical protein